MGCMSGGISIEKVTWEATGLDPWILGSWEFGGEGDGVEWNGHLGDFVCGGVLLKGECDLMSWTMRRDMKWMMWMMWMMCT